MCGVRPSARATPHLLVSLERMNQRASGERRRGKRSRRVPHARQALPPAKLAVGQAQGLVNVGAALLGPLEQIIV